MENLLNEQTAELIYIGYIQAWEITKNPMDMKCAVTWLKTLNQIRREL